jgi:hypothetical protein
MCHKGNEGYAEEADALTRQYESVRFVDVHGPVLTMPSDVLDIGAGIGRDAAALVAMEYRGALELPEVAPGGTVRHAHARDRLSEGSERVRAREELRSAVTELHPPLEHDPDLEFRCKRATRRHTADDSLPNPVQRPRTDIPPRRPARIGAWRLDAHRAAHAFLWSAGLGVTLFRVCSRERSSWEAGSALREVGTA